MRQVITFNNKNWTLPIPVPSAGPPSDEIWYGTWNDSTPVTLGANYSYPNTVLVSIGNGVAKYSENITHLDQYAINYYALNYLYIPKSITTIGIQAFINCLSLQELYYAGTISEWNNINISSGWKASTPISIIHCKNGDVTI